MPCKLVALDGTPAIPFFGPPKQGLGDYMNQPAKPADLIAVADVEVASVTPERAGFALEGLGADRSEYRVGLEIEVPMDQRTRSVLGEILSHCRIMVWRRPAIRREPYVKSVGRPAVGESQ